MADAVDTEVLFNGTRKYKVRITNISDGTGETAVAKVDRSGLIGPNGVAPSKLVIEQIEYSVAGFEEVTLKWDDATDETIAVLSGDGYKDYREAGGLVPDASPSALGDATGDILLTTNAGGTAEAAGDNYDITLHLRLKA